MRFVNIKLKLANMRKEKSFTLYPLTKDDKHVHIQSDKRFCVVELATGKAVINKKGCDYANYLKVKLDPLAFTLTDEQLKELREKVSIMIGNTNQDGTFRLV